MLKQEGLFTAPNVGKGSTRVLLFQVISGTVQAIEIQKRKLMLSKCVGTQSHIFVRDKLTLLDCYHR